MSERYARIIGTGSYLPSRVLTNHDLQKMVDTSDEWITTRTGIKQRHIAADDESAATMALQAGQQALKHANIQPSSIQLLIVATSTPERLFPSTACLVQQRLGVSAGTASFDLNAACAGFSYALHTANQAIRSGQVDTALVIGSEAMSRVLDWQDRSTCVLFGDGAGAVVLQADNQTGVLASQIGADGQYTDLLYTENRDATMIANLAHVKMQGGNVFKLAVNTLSQLVDESMALAGIPASQLDWLVPHQANIRIIQACARKLNLPMDKVILTIADHGNTSAASIPLALHCGISDGRIKTGDTLLLESFGAGLAWGGAVVRY